MTSMEDESTKLYRSIDRSLQTTAAQFTGGISPAAFLLAFLDWSIHLLNCPAKQLELTRLANRYGTHCIKQMLCHLGGEPFSGEFAPLSIPTDKRFTNPLWQHFPYNHLYESFLMMQQWWDAATTHIKGVNHHHRDVVNFITRQWLDMCSPSNSVLLNPEVIQKTIETNGHNFIKGFENWLEDIKRYEENLPPVGAEAFMVGKNIALTPGKVIYKNRLIELIQYAPATKRVYKEPVLITPAWIMKYYILDLTPKHSLVQYLVKKGHTVFMISWKNPTAQDRDLGMEDYLELGIFKSLEMINTIAPHIPVHLVGYCLGGTLAAIAASTLKRQVKHDKYASYHHLQLKSLTLFAAQVDFKEPGELGLFIDESQIDFLEKLMAEKGYLDTKQMSAAFQLLRSNDLIWSRLIREYLLGERKPMTDLMAWNADGTRLPYRMHSEYLRKLFLHNALSAGKYEVDHKPIALTDITAPMFVVATERDHVSPWRSVYKINLLTNSDVTFVLTSGGHNVGIVSLPVKKTRRYYRMTTIQAKDHFLDADSWYAHTKPQYGSWWLAWEKWLSEVSSEERVTPPAMGGRSDVRNKRATAMEWVDAPGEYVLEK